MAAPTASRDGRISTADRAERKREHAWGGKRGFLWVTLALFIISLAGHWGFGWLEYQSDQEEHGAAVDGRDYFNEMMRGTLENWQSEFLQLIWQVAGLSFLWYVGSPQSKEGDERKEELMKHVLRKVDPDNAEQIIRDLEKKFPTE